MTRKNEGDGGLQVVFPQKGVVTLERSAVPEPGPGELVVRIARVGVCDTDLHLLDGQIGDPFPLVPGHEFVGVVDAVGPGDDRGIGVGDPVAVEMLVPCHRCDRCREGRHNLCELDDPVRHPGPGRQLGVNIPRTTLPFAGGYATHLVVPRDGVVHRIPDGLDLDTAVLVEPLAVAVRAVERGRVGLGDKVVVIGPGPIGLLAAAAASAAGASEVVVVGGRTGRLALARAFGATETVAERGRRLVAAIRERIPGGPDVVIESAGSVDAQLDAIRIVRRGGRVVLAGACGSGPVLSVPSDDYLLTREIDILPSFLAAGGYEHALALLAQGRFPFASLVTHVYPLADVEQAFAAVHERTEGLLKAVLVPPSP
jgi:threonine dehydrogenase-like Zn-dependent dehydrogenase